MKRRLLILMALVLLLVPVAGSVQAQDDEPIRIGIVTDLSGWLSIYGVEQVNGFKLGLLYEAGIDPADYASLDEALADVRVAGRSVEVLVRDYGSEDPLSDADNAANATRELIESEFADIIVGTPNSSAALQVQTLTSPDEYNAIFMAGPSAAPSITGESFNPNTFRVCRNSLQDAQSLATEVDRFGNSYVVLAVDTAFGRGTAAAFDFAFSAAELEKAGDNILVPSDTVDFTPYLQQVLDSDADMVVQVWAGGGGITLAQQTVELGVLDEMALVTGTNSNDIVAAAPPPPGTIAYIVYQYTLPQTEVNDWLVSKHVAEFQDVPDLFTECSFATAQAVVQGLEATAGDPFPEAMIPALEGLTFDGPKGEYTIRESDHQALAPQYVIEFAGVQELVLEDGVFVAVTDDTSDDAPTLTMPLYDLVAGISAEDSEPPCMLTDEYADRCATDDMSDDMDDESDDS